MRTRMYGGVRGRKTKIGGKPTFVFLLLDYVWYILTRRPESLTDLSKPVAFQDRRSKR